MAGDDGCSYGRGTQKNLDEWKELLLDGLKRLEEKLDALDGKVQNHLLHRLPVWVMVVMAVLTSIIGWLMAARV